MCRTAILTDYFKKIKVTNFALCDVAFFTLKNDVFCEMCKYKVICACRKITASQAFQENLKSEQHFVHICSTKCHPHLTVNVENVCRNCVHPLIKCGFHFTDFSETHSHLLNICGYLLCQIASEPNKEI